MQWHCSCDQPLNLPHHSVIDTKAVEVPQGQPEQSFEGQLPYKISKENTKGRKTR